MKKVVGAGSLIVDITGYAAHLPVDGETTLGSAIRLGPGGKGNNQITAAHRAGVQTKIISKVGTDSLADILLGHYKSEGMSTEYIETVENGITGAALIEVNEESAQNRIIVVKGVNDDITAKDVDAAEADFADCGAVLTQLETSMESVLECKRLAGKHGKPFILNPAPFQEVPSELLNGIDYVTPNETEAEFFTGVPVTDDESAKKAAEKLLLLGVKHVIITLGKKGAYYYDGKTEILVPPVDLKAIDTTGAGDAFNGGFAAAIASGYSIEHALKFASCVAGLSVTKKGTAPAMPQRNEILDLFKKEYKEDLEEIYG